MAYAVVEYKLFNSSDVHSIVVDSVLHRVAIAEMIESLPNVEVIVTTYV